VFIISEVYRIGQKIRNNISDVMLNIFE